MDSRRRSSFPRLGPELLLKAPDMTEADRKIKQALDRYKAECNAANADMARRQADGTATTDEWLKFSERIRRAAEQAIEAAA